MVASRKPKARGERRPNETLEEMYERVISTPVGTRHYFSRDEAVYVLRRLSEGPPDYDSPSGDELVKRFYGLWPEPASDDDYPP